MGTKADNENVFMINVNPNTVEELLDEGKSFKEINEAMKPIYEPAYLPSQYEYDWDTMVRIQQEEWERLKNIKLELKMKKVI